MDGQRRTAAIMFTDIVGYSRLMGQDEEGTLLLLEEHNRVVLPQIRARGQLLKLIGDATLSAYDSAQEAVEAAIAIQRALRSRELVGSGQTLQVRAGIHVGDVIFTEGDVFGDGVNIAARVEPLAPAGGICVTGAVRDMLHASPELRFVDLGEHQLKNIERPVRIYRVPVDASDRQPAPGLGWRPWVLAGAGLLLALGGWGMWSWLGTSADPGPLVPRRVTFNTADNALYGSDLSSDGVTLAWVDGQGLHTRSLDTEAPPVDVPIPEGVRPLVPSFYPDDHLLLLGVDDQGRGLWELGASPRHLGHWPDLRRVEVSPQGGRAAILTDSGLFAVDLVTGEDRVILRASEEEGLRTMAWAPDGQRLAVIFAKGSPGETEARLEVVSVDGAQLQRLVEDPALVQYGGAYVNLAWPRQDALFYTVAQGTTSAPRAALLVMDPEHQTEPRVVHSWPRVSVVELQAGGGRIGVELLDLTRHVVLSELQGQSLGPLTQLTDHDAGEVATGWLPDGRLLLSSRRHGGWRVVAQAPEGEPEVLTTGQGEDRWPVAFGQDVLFLRKDVQDQAQRSLVLLSGGQEVVLGRFDDLEEIVCSASTCLAQRATEHRVSWSPVGPSGLGEPVLTLDGTRSLSRSSALSPDGGTLALVEYQDHVTLIDLDSGLETGRVQVPGSDLQRVAWRSDGQALFLTGYRPLAEEVFTLWQVDLQGQVLDLLGDDYRWMAWPLPSPDGQSLVFTRQTIDSDLWVLE